MAAITPTVRRAQLPDGRTVVQYYGTGASNQADTFTTPSVKAGSQRLLSVSVSYDGSATFTGTALTIGVDSGISALYDYTLTSGTDNTQFTVYLPTPALHLILGDAIVVAAPAAGAGREASIIVTMLQE